MILNVLNWKKKTEADVTLHFFSQNINWQIRTEIRKTTLFCVRISKNRVEPAGFDEKIKRQSGSLQLSFSITHAYFSLLYSSVFLRFQGPRNALRREL